MVTIMAGAQRALEALKPCPARAGAGAAVQMYRCLSVPRVDGQGALSGQPETASDQHESQVIR